MENLINTIEEVLDDNEYVVDSKDDDFMIITDRVESKQFRVSFEEI